MKARTHALGLLLTVLLPHFALANDLGTAHQHLKVGDFKKALPILNTLAEQGDPIAQGRLGTMYLNGGGVVLDAKKAAYWYEKSATSGHKHVVVTHSMFQMAALFRGHRDHPRDLKQAAYWYERAANAGDVEAMNQLGILYYDGSGVEKNYATAFQWFSKAAQQNHPEAQSFIGDLYRFGHSVKQDYAQALQWYEKAAAQDYRHAFFMLGALHDQGLGVTQDRAKAKTYYAQAAIGDPKTEEPQPVYRTPVLVIEGVANDPEYGYHREKAIRTGGFTVHNHHAYLDRLRGPNGQPVQYQHFDGECGAYKGESQPSPQALSTCYTVTYKGQKKPVLLFFYFYGSDKLWVPRGFTFEQQ